MELKGNADSRGRLRVMQRAGRFAAVHESSPDRFGSMIFSDIRFYHYRGPKKVSHFNTIGCKSVFNGRWAGCKSKDLRLTPRGNEATFEIVFQKRRTQFFPLQRWGNPSWNDSWNIPLGINN